MGTFAPFSWVKESTQLEPCAKYNSTQQELLTLLRRAKLFRPASLIEQCYTNRAMLHCECGNELRIVRQHCRQAFCPDCQRTKGFKVAKEVEASLNLLRENAPGLRVLFLTVTIPACDACDLKKEISRLPKEFTRMIRAPELKPYMIGSFRVVETGYNRKAQTFHPHLHALLIVRASFFSKGYLSQARFLSLWQKVSKRSDSSQLRVNPVKPKNKTSLSAEVAGVVQYMLKPIVPSHWTPDSILTLSQTIQKRRSYCFLGEDFKVARKLLPPYKPACQCASCLSELDLDTP